jgi:hypothetical protein
MARLTEFHRQHPLRAAQSRLRFSSHISKSAPHGTKSTSVFKSHSKVRFDSTTTSQAPRLDAKLLLGISLARGLLSKYYLRITLACFARYQARGLRTNNYLTWLIRLSYLGGYTLQEYSDDGFDEH